jgi:diguanylate cyclase (GGDEF)-like protein
VSIRTKIISLLALLFAILIVLEVAVQKQILMPSFADLEREEAQTSMKRVGYALDTALENLELGAAEWGDWEEAYKFVRSPNLPFVEKYFPLALKELKVDALLIVDLNGDYVLSKARSVNTGEPLDLDLVAGKALPKDFPWRENLAQGKPAKGLLRTNNGVMMIAAAPVLNGSGSGRHLGMVILGRLLTPTQVQMIGAQAQASLTMLSDPPSTGGVQITETDTLTQVVRPFVDIYGRPLMSFRIDTPRRITARGQGVVTYASLYLIGAAVAVLLLLVVVLNRIVLKPLTRVTRHAVAVGKGAGSTGRLIIPGRDEIASLAQEFNRMVERVEYMAYHDGLTGLPNRTMFSKLLDRSISEAHRSGKRLAVAFLDLDRFKQINDTLGHEAGDQLLQQVASRLKGCVRDSDTVARLGGDEFVVLLAEMADEKYAAIVAQKILAAAARPFTLMGQEFRVTASIGISTYPQDGLDEQTLTKNADIAMYQAKAEGKNNFQFYSEKLNANSLERLTLESSLRHAIERHEFRLHYQAKRDIASGKITGMEALLRWEHPDLGTVAPMQFIPVAEETGLIIPIGKWVLKTVCLQSIDWQKQGLPALSIAVNLTARQFRDEELLSDVASILTETGIDPRLLEIELKESLLIHDVENTLRILTGLKGLGVRIAVDDFGAGYSSLTLLHQYPLDTIKIDRSFVRDIAGTPEDTRLADAIIAMGNSLSLTVVAQGVETREQAEHLRLHACGELQGFYFKRPLPVDEFTQLLRDQATEITYIGKRLALNA